MKSKRHSPPEISAKLEQAHALAAAGKRQSEIASTLGVSIMTLHRWRKLDPPDMAASPAAIASSDTARTVAELQIENRRLRQIVMNLLLEKIKLEEAVGVRAA
jgi:putative transposase